MRLRAIASASDVVARIGRENGGAARPVMVNGRSVPTTVR